MNLEANLRKYAVESRDVLSDSDIDKALFAELKDYVYRTFGHTMSMPYVPKPRDLTEAHKDYVGLVTAEKLVDGRGR